VTDGTSKERKQPSHRLFQCFVTAIWPVWVEELELEEIFAIKFDEDAAPNLMEGWWPENAEESVPSAFSALL
jgi:hypothetical protein